MNMNVKCCVRCNCVFVCLFVVVVFVCFFLNVFMDEFNVIIFFSFLAEQKSLQVEVMSAPASLQFSPPRQTPDTTHTDFITVASENTEALLSEVGNHRDFGEFLHADFRLPIHCTSPDSPHCLRYTFDVDGVVIQVRHMRGIVAEVGYLNLPLLDPSRLKRQYSYLKKHVSLPRCSPEGLAALKNCLGHKISNVAGGYVLTLCAVPSSLTNPDLRLQNPRSYAALAAELFCEVREAFGRLLDDLPQKDMSRPTVQKQGTTNLASYRVLRADQSFILSLLDQAVETANSCSFLQVIATLGQFGQRDPGVLKLGDSVLPGSVGSVSVHLASKVLAAGEDTHLLLSRHGLLPLIGVRGSLFSTLGMHETCNFQSNLNTLRTDVGQAIMRVLSKTGEVTFLQLYADAPHIHYNQPFKHPVSGVLVTCGLSHPNFKATLTGRALAYLKHIRDLRLRLVCQVGCRIEQVVRFEDVEECLVRGFAAEVPHTRLLPGPQVYRPPEYQGVVFFPALKFTDLRSTRRIWWNFKDWVQVSHGDQSILQMSDVASKTLQVMAEIERRSLCFSKHLEVYREHGNSLAEAPKGDDGRFAPQHADLHLLCGPAPEWRLHRFRAPERPLPTNELGGRVTGQTAAAADPGEIHPGQSEESEDLEPASDRPVQGTHGLACLCRFIALVCDMLFVFLRVHLFLFFFVLLLLLLLSSFLSCRNEGSPSRPCDRRRPARRRSVSSPRKMSKPSVTRTSSGPPWCQRPCACRPTPGRGGARTRNPSFRNNPRSHTKWHTRSTCKRAERESCRRDHLSRSSARDSAYWHEANKREGGKRNKRDERKREKCFAVAMSDISVCECA